ncbi:MAG: hypothetical protein DLM59_18015 [Pseudonocardiales bacterium]|nr:MAG: hypothetical protein DLM59_18015 [Pseudonocardiales bacterium]
MTSHSTTAFRMALRMPSTDDFLTCYGDAIDDRVAELLDEAERARPRPRLRSAFAVLLLALAASVLLRHSGIAVVAVWVSTAAVYRAAVRITEPRRS